MAKKQPKKRTRRSVNLSVMEDKRKAQKARSTRTDFWKPENGVNKIRILPPWADGGVNEGMFYRELYIHWNIPPGAESQSFAVCTRKTEGADGKCYLCDEVDRLYSGGSPEDIQIAKEIRSRQRFFSNVIDMNDTEDDMGNPKIQIFAYGPKIFEGMLAYFCDSEYGDLTDPDDGFVVIIEREGKGRDTTYQVRCSRNPSSWEDQGWDEDFIFDGLKDLDALDEVSDYYALKSYSSQKSLYIGYEEEEVQQLEADDEEEEEDFDDDEDFEEDEEDDDSSAIEARLKAAVKGGSKRRGRRT